MPCSSPNSSSSASWRSSSQPRVASTIRASSSSTSNGRQLAGDAQRVVDAHQHPLGQPQAPVDGLGAERVAQDLADPDPVGRVEAVAREEHEARHEALVAVRAHEQPHALALAELEDPARDPVELVDLHLDQLVARERVDDLDQRLVVVAAGREPGALAHRLRLAPQHRDVGRHLAIRGGRVEAEEAVLADRRCRRRRSA